MTYLEVRHCPISIEQVGHVQAFDSFSKYAYLPYLPYLDYQTSRDNKYKRDRDTPMWGRADRAIASKSVDCLSDLVTYLACFRWGSSRAVGQHRASDRAILSQHRGVRP